MRSVVRCAGCFVAIPPSAPRWTVGATREVLAGDSVQVLDAVAAYALCETCADSRDVQRLALPAAGEASSIPSPLPAMLDSFSELLGEPWRVLHSDAEAALHVDVFVYQPGQLFEGWTLVTCGRSRSALAGEVFLELVMHLPAASAPEAIDEAAEGLRRLALTVEQAPTSWSFAWLDEPRFVRLGRRLAGRPRFLRAHFTRG
ncbi:MAG: hypothetical protein MUC96_14990 [Myxococcaceae bacterium]|nr:hypothetical protein [Myxococcaceae bacterium]